VKGSYLYATVLNTPEDGVIRISSLGEKDASKLPHFHGMIREVSILGYDGELTWFREEEAMVIKTYGLKSDYPIVCKIRID
jgi:alpha-L-fucosidase